MNTLRAARKSLTEAVDTFTSQNIDIDTSIDQAQDYGTEDEHEGEAESSDDDEDHNNSTEHDELMSIYDSISTCVLDDGGSDSEAENIECVAAVRADFGTIARKYGADTATECTQTLEEATDCQAVVITASECSQSTQSTVTCNGDSSRIVTATAVATTLVSSTQISGPQNSWVAKPDLEEFIASDREAAKEIVQLWAAAEGFMCVSRNSKPDRYYLRCSRHHVADTHQSSNRSSRRPTKERQICGWKVTIKQKSADSDTWVIMPNSAYFTHTHHGRCDGTTFPEYARIWRRLHNQELQNTIKKVQTPSKVVAALREVHGGTLGLKSKDVSNLLYLENIQRLMGRDETTAMMQGLCNSTDWYRKRYFCSPTETRPLERLFLVHQASYKTFKQCNSVLFVDGTYRTNKYNMQLIHIVGMGPDRRSYTAAICLLSGEKRAQEDYAWLFAQLKELYNTLDHNSPADSDPVDTFIKSSSGYTPGSKYNFEIPRENVGPATIFTDREQAFLLASEEVFPTSYHLLCTWHIINDVRSWVIRNQSKVFVKSAQAPASYDTFSVDELLSTEDNDQKLYAARKWSEISRPFRAMLAASTEYEFKQQWEEIVDLVGKSSAFIPYMENQWMRYKVMWAYYHTKKYPTFGYQATSRVESAHAALKKWLKPRSSLGELVQSMAGFLKEQRGTSEAEIEKHRALIRGKASSRQSKYVSTKRWLHLSVVKKLWGHVHKKNIGIMAKQYMSYMAYVLRQCRLGVAQFDSFMVCPEHCTTRQHTGLPCKHKLLRHHRIGIPLESIDPGLYLVPRQYAEKVMLASNPVQNQSLRGVPHSKTGRPLCSFEIDSTNIKHVKMPKGLNKRSQKPARTGALDKENMPPPSTPSAPSQEASQTMGPAKKVPGDSCTKCGRAYDAGLVRFRLTCFECQEGLARERKLQARQ